LLPLKLLGDADDWPFFGKPLHISLIYLPIPIIPKIFLKSFNTLLFYFLWRSNWERVRRIILCNDIEAGGAKMLNLESYLTSLQVKLFNEDFVSQWKLSNHCILTMILCMLFYFLILNLTRNLFKKPILWFFQQ